MKKTLPFLVVLVALLIAASFPLHAEKISVAGTGVTFDAPAGFKPVPADIIAAKFPTNRAPQFVIGNKAATTTIAYDLKPHLLPEEKLPEAQKAFTDLFGRVIPGIQWKKNEIISLAGRKWLFLEMTSNALDTDIHNLMLVTGYDGKMLIFNFNSTKEEFPKVETDLRRSLDSIAIAEKKTN